MFGMADGLDELLFEVPSGVSAGSAPVVLTINGTTAPTVSIALALTKQPSIGAISDSASGLRVSQSGSWISIYGSFLSERIRTWQRADFSDNMLPTTIEGVRVMVNGRNAAISYVSPGQVNVQLPGDVGTGITPVSVNNTFGSVSGSIDVQSYATGFFAFQGGTYVAAVHSDGVYVAHRYFGPTVPRVRPGLARSSKCMGLDLDRQARQQSPE